MSQTHGGDASNNAVIACSFHPCLINIRHRVALPLYTSLLDFAGPFVPGISLSNVLFVYA
jgi:hypothetical protein